MRASELPEHALVDLFNAGYSDYLLPMRLTTAAFAEHVAASDIDLECSRVVRDDQPAALALIARRDGAGWVGGMATVPGVPPSRAGRGGADRGLGGARRSRRERRVAGGDRSEPAGACAVREARLRGGARPGRVVAARTRHGFDAVPDDRRIERSRLDPRQPPGPRAVAASGRVGGRDRRARGDAARPRRRSRWPGRRNRALARRDAPAVEALQVVATDEQAAAQLLLAAAGAGRELRFRNVPDDAPASLALERLGARRIATQHEMRLRL